MKKPKYFDIHSHLNDEKFLDDSSEAISRMEAMDIATFVVGTDQKMSQDAVRLAKDNDSVYAIVGLHPTDTDEDFDGSVYKDLLKDPKVVGVGECGLDYLHIKENTDQERKKQLNCFEEQLELAVEFKKPLMIHCRDAHQDLLPVLESKKKAYGDELWGNIHFFTAGVDIAKRYYNINFTTSFTGVLTFTHDYDEVVKYAPLSMVMSETDAPYVAPVPYRGKRNEPAYVVEIVEKIAQIRGEDLETAKETLVDNVFRVFRLSED